MPKSLRAGANSFTFVSSKLLVQIACSSYELVFHYRPDSDIMHLSYSTIKYPVQNYLCSSSHFRNRQTPAKPISQSEGQRIPRRENTHPYRPCSNVFSNFPLHRAAAIRHQITRGRPHINAPGYVNFPFDRRYRGIRPSLTLLKSKSGPKKKSNQKRNRVPSVPLQLSIV